MWSNRRGGWREVGTRKWTKRGRRSECKSCTGGWSWRGRRRRTERRSIRTRGRSSNGRWRIWRRGRRWREQLCWNLFLAQVPNLRELVWIEMQNRGLAKLHRWKDVWGTPHKVVSWLQSLMQQERTRWYSGYLLCYTKCRVLTNITWERNLAFHWHFLPWVFRLREIWDVQTGCNWFQNEWV